MFSVNAVRQANWGNCLRVGPALQPWYGWVRCASTWAGVKCPATRQSGDESREPVIAQRHLRKSSAPRSGLPYRSVESSDTPAPRRRLYRWPNSASRTRLAVSASIKGFSLSMMSKTYVHYVLERRAYPVNARVVRHLTWKITGWQKRSF